MVDAGCQCPYVTDSAGALLMHEARPLRCASRRGRRRGMGGYHGHQTVPRRGQLVLAQAGVRQIDVRCAHWARLRQLADEVLAPSSIASRQYRLTCSRCWPAEESCVRTCIVAEDGSHAIVQGWAACSSFLCTLSSG